LLTVCNTAGLIAAATGGVLILSMATSSRTLGATRSYRLKCEERQQQIEAVAKDDAQQRSGYAREGLEPAEQARVE